MFKNYLKITWAVMKRNKFYTFISLFGISMTLTILIVLAAFFDQLLAPTYPEVNRERSLYVQRIKLLDTVNHSSSTSPTSLSFMKNYLKTMTLPEKIGITSDPHSANTYLNKRKGKVFIKYTDAEFWQITQFTFFEGKGFTTETIQNSDKSVIINDVIRDQYFGKSMSVVGKNLEMGDEVFRIVGVVKHCAFTQLYVNADIYLPYTADKSPVLLGELGGKYNAIILAKSKADLPRIQADFINLLHKIPLNGDNSSTKHGHIERSSNVFHPDTLIAQAETYAASFTTHLTEKDRSQTEYNDGSTLFYSVLGIFAFLFMLLPALNLVNINISRIMERASEIGIRKAYGASAATLSLQFIIENVILTVIGGIIAIVFSALIIYYLNQKGIGPLTTLSLSINWLVVLIALLLCFIFGLMSGAYPAWRMSKLSVVDALKN